MASKKTQQALSMHLKAAREHSKKVDEILTKAEIAAAEEIARTVPTSDLPEAVQERVAQNDGDEKAGVMDSQRHDKQGRDKSVVPGDAGFLNVHTAPFIAKAVQDGADALKLDPTFTQEKLDRLLAVNPLDIIFGMVDDDGNRVANGEGALPFPDEDEDDDSPVSLG